MDLCQTNCSSVDQKCLIPEIDVRMIYVKDKFPDFNQSAICIIDELQQHFILDLENFVWHHNIEPVPMPAHSSDQIQPFDLCLFVCFETMIPQQKSHSYMSTIENNIVKVLTAL